MTSAVWILVTLIATAVVLQYAGSQAQALVTPEDQIEIGEALQESPEQYSKDDVDVLVRYNLQCDQFTVDINLFNHFEDVLITVLDEDARVLCEGSMQPKYFQRTSCEFPVPTTLKDGGNYLDIAIRRADDGLLVYRERHYYFHLVNQVIAVRAGRLSLGGRLRQLALTVQEQAHLVTALSLLGVAMGPLRIALMRYKRSVEAAVVIVPPADAPAPPAPPSDGPRWSPRAFFAPRVPPSSTIAYQEPPQIALSRQAHPLLYGEQVLSLLLTWALRQPQRLLGNVRDKLRLPAPVATSTVPSLPAPTPVAASQRGSLAVAAEPAGAKPFWWSAPAADAAPAVAVTAQSVEAPATGEAATAAAPQKAAFFAWPSYATESPATDAHDEASAANTAASWPSSTARSPRPTAPAAPAAPVTPVPASPASPTPPSDDASFTVLRLATLAPARRLAETLHQILVPPLPAASTVAAPPAASVAPPAAAAVAKAAAAPKVQRKRRPFFFRRSPSTDVAAAAVAAVAPVTAAPGPVERQSKAPVSLPVRWPRWRQVMRGVVVAVAVVAIASQRPHELLVRRAASSLAATRDWWADRVVAPVRERLARPRAAPVAVSPPLVALTATSSPSPSPSRPLIRRARRLRSSWALLPSTLAVGPQALPLSVTDTRLFREVDRCLLERRPPCASLVAVSTDAAPRRSASGGDVATRRRRRSSSVASAAAASRWWLVMGQCLVALWPAAWRPAKQLAPMPQRRADRDVAATANANDETTVRPSDIAAAAARPTAASGVDVFDADDDEPIAEPRNLRDGDNEDNDDDGASAGEDYDDDQGDGDYDNDGDDDADSDRTAL